MIGNAQFVGLAKRVSVPWLAQDLWLLKVYKLIAENVLTRGMGGGNIGAKVVPIIRSLSPLFRSSP